MAKAILIMDMPNKCHECPFAYITLSERECFVKDMDIDVDVKREKPSWCPLRECPQKREKSNYYTDWSVGYNACIDEILGGGE